MALINNNKRYIKLDAHGSFEIYINEEARARFKASTSSNTIIKKYEEVITRFYSPEYAELRYYNTSEYNELVQAWYTEYHRYLYNKTNNIYDEEYPLMAEYYRDVADSIPKVVARGFLGGLSEIAAETAEEAYNSAKQNKIWGETVDA